MLKNYRQHRTIYHIVINVTFEDEYGKVSVVQSYSRFVSYTGTFKVSDEVIVYKTVKDDFEKNFKKHELLSMQIRRITKLS